jgi:hypothetical protein
MMSSRSRDVILFLVECRVSIVLLMIEFVVNMSSDEVMSDLEVIILNENFENCSLKVDELRVLIREFRRDRRSNKTTTLFMIFS